MTTAMGALKGFLHLFTSDWARQGDSSRRVITILDVLEPRSQQG